MNVPIHGHLQLHFQKDIIAAFFPLLQKGFCVVITTDNLQSMLCRTCGLDPTEVKARIQTLFLNGKPVDDLAKATLQDGDCLALSAAMPGLVGATMRSGGILASFRDSISHRPADTRSNAQGGILSIKLFNLLIKELGPRFLQQGILIGANDLRGLLTRLSDREWKECHTAVLDCQKISPHTLAATDWPDKTGFVLLEVTFGQPPE
jgi:hypothetical protein